MAAILSDERLHLWRLIYLLDVLSKLLGELIDESNELRADAHDHITNIILPLVEIVYSFCIIKDVLLRLVSYLVESLKRGDITLINILYIFLVDQT